jgi:tRNA threonylcarbamoyl adenosine modification protein (Sua5/YciO/YrdC/YwlC family)
MLLKVYEQPSQRHLDIIRDCLKSGGVIIYPTDTLYALGCDIFNHQAVEKVCRIKQIKPEKAEFSFICHDLSSLSDFTKQISNPVFKLMKRSLPGPFTFILNANHNVPVLFKRNKKTIGIRVPDNDIIRSIIHYLGNPIMSTSLTHDDQNIEYSTDPSLIHEVYKNDVDIIIDGGYGGLEVSTVIDCTGDEPFISRAGKGFNDLLL